MTLCVFDRRAKVIDLRLKNIALFWNLKVLNLIVLASIKDAILVGRKVPAEKDVIAVGAKATLIEGFDQNFAPLHRLEDLRICKNHGGGVSSGKFHVSSPNSAVLGVDGITAT